MDDIKSAIYRVDVYSMITMLLVNMVKYAYKDIGHGFLELAEMLKKDDEKMKEIYLIPECKASLQYLLKTFDSRGCLDFEEELEDSPEE